MIEFGGYRRDGKIIPIWVNRKDMWMIELLNMRMNKKERGGVPSSLGNEIKEILKSVLSKELCDAGGKDHDTP